MALNSGAISFGEVVKKDDEKILGSTKASYQEVLTGEFLINPLNLNYDLISLRIALSKIDVVVSAGYIVIKEKTPIVKEYFKYFLHRYDVAYMKLLGSGVRQTISFNHIANSLLIFPPLNEQSKIANFLDQKTAQIDQAIAIKQKQIELLKERKQIVIQQAVTKGIERNVSMIDSGVAWIGKIPAHWMLTKLGSCLSPFSEKNHPQQPLLSITREYGVIERDADDKESNHNFIPDDLSGYKLIKNGQFGMNKMKAWQGSYGISNFTGIVSPAYFIFNLMKDIEPTFFHWAIRSQVYITFFASASDGVRIGQWDLSKPRMKQIPFVVPKEREEQIKIADFLERYSIETAKTIGGIESQILKLKEYRTTLINSAVTGKIRITPEMIAS
jgi:type I restriction enzyme S subunit